MNFGKFVSKASKGIGKIMSRPDSRQMKIARNAFGHKAAETVGHIAGTAGKVGGKVGKGAFTVATKGTADIVRQTPKIAVNALSPFVSKNKNSLLGYRLNPLGLGAAAIISAGVGVGSGVKEYAKTGMTGQNDGQHTPFAPRLPSYSFGEQSGATGDLVFALNNKRRGR